MKKARFTSEQIIAILPKHAAGADARRSRRKELAGRRHEAQLESDQPCRQRISLSVSRPVICRRRFDEH